MIKHCPHQTTLIILTILWTLESTITTHAPIFTRVISGSTIIEEAKQDMETSATGSYNSTSVVPGFAMYQYILLYALVLP